MAAEMDLFKTPTEPSFFIGQVQSEIFTSPDSFYKVLIVSVEDANFDWNENEITVTGSFGDLTDDQTYRFEGQLVDHPRYGRQFQAQSYHVNQPTSREGVINFLSGKQFAGVGKKTAEKIVDTLGNNAIDKITKDPHVLDDLTLRHGIKQTIVDSLQANQGMDQIIIGLNDLGFGSNLSSKIFDKYGDETLHVIHENPYKLAVDIDEISFRRADQVAAHLQIPANDPRRIDAAIFQSLSDLTNATGNTYTTAQPLLQQTLTLLTGDGEPVTTKQVGDRLVDLEKKKAISYEEKRIYPAALYKAEFQIADHLHRIITTAPEKVNEKEVDRIVKKLGVQTGIEYDPTQVMAIKKALNNKVLLLTGGPGTGKTTIIKGIVAAYAKLHELSLDLDDYKDDAFPVLLAAPTGRAAKRMSESTDLPASTIHRMLGLNGREVPTDMNARDIKGSLLIIDEMSMVDTLLFKTLVQAIPTSMHVILVGDKDQLPSVGPGQVFHDLLAFPELPQVELTDIHRQSAESTIIPLAHAVKEGRVPANLTAKTADRSFIRSHADKIPYLIKRIIQLATNRGYSPTDLQILAPMHRGQAGIDNLNQLAQQVYNPPAEQKQEVDFRGQLFRVGDKVLQTENSPENNVFNGDIGKIVAIEKKAKGGQKNTTMTIDFDGNEVHYGRTEWDQLRLAYCISIHKAQGSQFKMVVLPLVRQFSRMLQRNLVYTAITRAAEKLVFVGEAQAVATAIEHEGVNRQTSLLARLNAVWGRYHDLQQASGQPTDQAGTSEAGTSEAKKAAKPTPTPAEGYILTPELVASGQIDPLIGMEGITPQDLDS